MTYAAGILYRAGDRVLLLKRGYDCDEPGTWGLPGGKIEPGETPGQAAIRESTEETGFDPTGFPLDLLREDGQYTTFFTPLPAPFEPVLNSEHSESVWAPLNELPAPLHPGLAPLLTPMSTATDTLSARQYDGNGWFEVKRNPISKVGVFPYSGGQLGKTGADAARIFQVLRPAEELASPECIESFKLLPWVDNHTMIGPAAQKMMDQALPAEAKGVHGVIGEQVFFEDGVLYGNIKTFSDSLAELIDAGKRELSAGYRCRWDFTPGVFEGQSYDAVQRQIRGNHLALVKEGRMGADVAVMDQFTFSFDAKEIIMADPEKKPAADEGEGGASMTLADALKMLKELAPQVAALQAAVSGMAKPADEVVVDKDPGTSPPAAGTEVVEVEDTKQVAMDAQLKSISTQFATFKANTTRDVLKDMAVRDALVARLTPVIGVFDHAELTAAEVAAYGCKHEKIGLTGVPPEAAVYALDAYLKAAPKAAPATVAMDSANTDPGTGSVVGQYLQSTRAAG